MQKALNEVLGGEYTVVVNKELSKLKQTDRMLLGEPCAVLYRTDANLGRPIEECEAEEKSCYIVFLPSKYSIVCNKDFGSFRNKDSQVKLISLNYLLEQLLEFNFTYLQLIEDPAILYCIDTFKDIVREYKNIIAPSRVREVMYTKFVSTADCIMLDIKSNKFRGNIDALSNRVFLIYKLCRTCKVMSTFGFYRLYDTLPDSYSVVVDEMHHGKYDSLNELLEDVKSNKYNNTSLNKEKVKSDKIVMKHNILRDLSMEIMNDEQTSAISLSDHEYLISRMTPDLNKRFCSDRKIPLKIFSGDIFIKRLKLFGEYESYIMFCKEYIKFFSNEQQYFAEYNKVKDKAIDYIKESAAFQTLNNTNMDVYACKYNFPQADVYKCSNVGKTFISIDMSKANFSALVHYGRAINNEFFKNFNYSEFMEQFTNIEHIINSKYIRQVIFGNCNPRRQVTYEKYIMSTVLDKLFEYSLITNEEVVSMCSDEIILSTDHMDRSRIIKIMDAVNELSADIPLKLEYFRLGKVDGSDAYIKSIYNNIYDLTKQTNVLKCVNPEEAPFIYRIMNGQEFTEDDSIFIHNDKLAKLIEQPDLRINFTGGYN